MNNDLNSALALFRSLYKAQKGDVYTIIERFILVGVKSRGLMSFTREEIVTLLKESFNLDIPFSVISKCIIAYQDVFQYKAGKYIVINPMDSEIDQIISEMNEIEGYKESVVNELVSFVEKKQNTKLTTAERAELTQYFFDFVIDKDRQAEGSDRLLITQFIICKEKDECFQYFINSIKEGMVIYKGIRYSDAPDDTSWETNTDFFLDEEYLFSAYGMNGSFYEKCFMEFYNFVEEINNASKMKGGRNRIRLFYFRETKEDVNAYFAQAVRIRRMVERYNYPKTAMDTILNECKEDVDVERYKTNFYRKLKEMHIEEYPDEIDLRRHNEFIFENSGFEEAKDKHFQTDQISEVNDYIKIADYINILREGKRSYPLEKCRYMFLSDGNLPNELSRFIREFYSEKRPYVITHMGTFTELMWFKLRKGVVGTDSSASISVVNKAKTVVSGLLYDNLKKQYDAVLASDEDETTKKAFYAELRTKRYAPDDINSETIVDDIAFIDDTDYLEKYKESQVLLKQQAARVTVLEKELEEEKAENQKTHAQLSSVLAYIASEESRKRKGAIQRARKEIRGCSFVLKCLVPVVNVLIITVFVLPSVFCMNPTWVNIATVVGTFIAAEVLINGWLAKTKTKRRDWLINKYRKVLQKEINSLTGNGIMENIVR